MPVLASFQQSEIRAGDLPETFARTRIKAIQAAKLNRSLAYTLTATSAASETERAAGPRRRRSYVTRAP